MSQEIFLTPAAAARFLEISISSLRHRIRRGDVRAYRLRRSRLIRLRREDVIALLEPVDPVVPGRVLRDVKAEKP